MLTHQGTQTLHTPRLILDRFSPEDARAMYDGWASDPQVTRFLTWPPHTSPELTRQLLESWCAQCTPRRITTTGPSVPGTA